MLNDLKQSSVETIWASAQEVLRSMLNAEIYKLWFAPLKATSLEGDCLTVEVPNDFCEVWIKDNYLGLVRDVLTHSCGQPMKLKFHVNNTILAPPITAPELIPANRLKTVSAETNGEDRNHHRDAGAPRDITLNPKNTFDNFVVGNNNILAHGAALAVAQTPGKSYNPLFLYGGVGLGKTHLLHAIGQHVTVHKKGARVAYISSERFTNEFIEAIQNNQMIRFRKRYRQTDVLLIDDIQFLAGKERIQEEFFHTFNALHEAHKQIVLTCDRPASEIQGLEQRLVSRFEWGLVTDLQPPDVKPAWPSCTKRKDDGHAVAG